MAPLFHTICQDPPPGSTFRSFQHAARDQDFHDHMVHSTPHCSWAIGVNSGLSPVCSFRLPSSVTFRNSRFYLAKHKGDAFKATSSFSSFLTPLLNVSSYSFSFDTPITLLILPGTSEGHGTRWLASVPT